MEHIAVMKRIYAILICLSLCITADAGTIGDYTDTEGANINWASVSMGNELTAVASQRGDLEVIEKSLAGVAQLEVPALVF
jgi:hypothetical protein